MESCEFFKCLSEPVRLRLLYLLTQRTELCVCEFTQALELPQSVVSRHLAYLREHEVITPEKRGRWVYYQINPQHLFIDWLESIQGLSTLEQQLSEDLQRLTKELAVC